MRLSLSAVHRKKTKCLICNRTITKCFLLHRKGISNFTCIFWKVISFFNVFHLLFKRREKFFTFISKVYPVNYFFCLNLKNQCGFCYIFFFVIVYYCLIYFSDKLCRFENLSIYASLHELNVSHYSKFPFLRYPHF